MENRLDRVHQKSLGGRACWGSLQCSPDPWAGFKGDEKGRRKGEMEEN